ncbi:MAG: hypothetical protein KBE65_20650 [Phycisphaerae bacterium]|nr:hypothetical protein [Phycisphaerae bacterium]
MMARIYWKMGLTENAILGLSTRSLRYHESAAAESGIGLITGKSGRDINSTVVIHNEMPYNQQRWCNSLGCICPLNADLIIAGESQPDDNGSQRRHLQANGIDSSPWGD